MGIGDTPKTMWATLALQIVLLVVGIMLAMDLGNVDKVGDQNTNTVTDVIENW